MSKLRRFIPFCISLAVTPFALFAGLVSVGAGHGNYVLALLLFPTAFMIGFVIKPFIPCPESGDCPERDMIIFAHAILQFPLYGLMFSVIGRKTLLAVLLIVTHLCLSAGLWMYLRHTGFL